jgi:hypothetical protein
LVWGAREADGYQDADPDDDRQKGIGSLVHTDGDRAG